MPRTREAAEDTANRRRQLKRWIDSRFGGVQAAFIAAHNLNQSEISSLLRDKSFGGVKARTLEVQCGMPPRYLEERGEPGEAGEPFWPFDSITPNEWMSLPYQVRRQAEAGLRAALEVSDPMFRPAPERTPKREPAKAP
jgi:hypothetical protein